MTAPPPPDPAESLFVRWLADREAGRAPAFEELLRAHPDHAPALRALNEELERVSRLASAAGFASVSSVSISVRLARVVERYGLDELQRPAGTEPEHATSELLRRLVAREPLTERYRLKDEVGRGGMGVVFKVEDVDLRRSLAMKAIHGRPPRDQGSDGATTKSLLARFLEEAQVTGQLDHPGIVPVHDLGVDDEGRVCFTMRLVRGSDLKHVFDLVFQHAEGWTETRALHVLLKVCDAMAYAHKKGVIHRDLKPANVMVGKFGEVYVMDWGLARVVGSKDPHDIRIRPATTSTFASIRTERRDERESEDDSPLVTMDGQVVGTPAYMSPEQASGHSDEVGPRADVYSLGAMLYHLLARHAPYLAPGMRIPARTVHALVTQGPPRRLHEIRDDVPGELIAICEKAMARQAADRYADMGELADDLRAYLEHRVVKAYATGPVAELRKWVRRNRGMAASIAAAIVIAIGALAWISIVQTQRRAQEHENAQMLAAKNAELAQRNAELAMYAGGMRVDRLREDAKNLRFATAEDVPPLESWLREARELVEGDGRTTGLAAWKRLAAEGRDAPDAGTQIDPRFARRIEILERDAKELAEHVAWEERKFAVRYEDAEAPTPEEEARGIDWSQLPPDWEGLNGAAWTLVQPDRPTGGPVERRAVAIARRSLDLVPPDRRPEVLDTLAWALFEAGRDEEAIEAIEEAFALAEQFPAAARLIEENRAKLLAQIEAKRGQSAKDERQAWLADARTHLANLRAAVEAMGLFRDEKAYLRDQSLRSLVAKLEVLSDPVRGLIAGTDVDAGYSIQRRHEFARTVEERSVRGADAARLWSEALGAIRDRKRSAHYDGLVLEPQLGLLPIGADPHSGLWEFAVLATGEVPQREQDGTLRFEAKSAVVLVLVPGGEFHLGAQASDDTAPNFDPDALDAEQPVRAITLAPFFISKHEMTQAQWQRLTGRTPSNMKAGRSLGRSIALPTNPVESIDWTTAKEALELIGLVLPTEAQWECAARGGKRTPWWCGEALETVEGNGNVADLSFLEHLPEEKAVHWNDGWPAHAPVGTFAPNPFGLHDTIGNVYEWCRDRLGVYTDQVREGDGERLPFAASKHVIRGGSWIGDPLASRSASREADEPTYKAPTLGLRPARAIQGAIQRSAG